jgi:hypothetical protein
MAEELALAAEKRGPGRPPRALTERNERRRRNGPTGTGSLDVPSEITDRLAAEGKEGRWINDLGNRMHDKTVNDDWDKVSDVEPRIVGMDKRTGQPINAYFCAKPKAFLEEDRKAHLDRLKEQERAIARGADGGELDQEGGSYRPKSRNRIGDIEL